jgi:hypothetical protein
MPVQKLLVVGASDGLVLQPTRGAASKPHTPPNDHAIVLAYGDGRISTRLHERRPESVKNDILEVHGVVGMMTQLLHVPSEEELGSTWDWL